jgi:hypothetical protein
LRRGYVAQEFGIFVTERDDGAADVEFDHDQGALNGAGLQA